MIAYIIKFVLCSGFLYSFYKVFLERESMYKINRFYLLLALIFAIIAPLYKMELPITENEMQLSPELIAYLMSNPQLLQKDTGFTWTDALDWIYSLVGIGLAIRFIINIMAIIYRIQQDEKYELEDLTIVLDQQSKQPFSFLHYIFLPKENYKEIHPNLIQHEKAHCIQKHSWDILFLEIYQIIFWFNPFVYLYKKSIQLNHEFLADEYVLQNDVDVKIYQHQILDCIATESQHSIASHFNFILTKKRLLMMTKNTSKRKIGILSFASVPFILSAFVLFSQKTFAQEVDQQAKKVENVLDQKVENPIIEFKKIAKDTEIIAADNITITLDSTNKRMIFPKEIKDIPKADIKNFSIDYRTETGKVELHSGETKEFKLENLAVQKNNIKIENGDQLKNIDPKEIKSIVVGKDRNFLQVIKKNNDTIKFNVESKFKASNSKILKLDELSTNEILTPTIKAELKDLDIKNFAGIEMLNRKGTKLIQVEDKILVFDSKDKLISQSSVPSKIETIVIDDNTLKELKNIPPIHNRLSVVTPSKTDFESKNGWSIDVQPHRFSGLTKNSSFPIIHGNSISVKSSYIETEPQTKEQIAKELDQLISKEKETKKRIKALEKQQKKLK